MVQRSSALRSLKHRGKMEANTASIPPRHHRPVMQHQSFFLASFVHPVHSTLATSGRARSEITNAGGRVQIRQPTTSATTGRRSSPIAEIRRMGRPLPHVTHVPVDTAGSTTGNVTFPQVHYSNSDNIVSHANDLLSPHIALTTAPAPPRPRWPPRPLLHWRNLNRSTPPTHIKIGRARMRIANTIHTPKKAR